MRKSLLSLALLAMAVPAFGTGRDRATRHPDVSRPGAMMLSPMREATDGPILQVDGEISYYTSHVYWVHEGATYYDEGILAAICRADDGATVYINYLMPAWQEGWLQGSMDEDGNLHFPSGQLVSRWGVGDIYMGGAVQNPRSGNMDMLDEFVLTATDEDGYRLADHGNSPLFILAYLGDGLMLEADYDLRLSLFTDTEATPPAEATEAKYVRTYFDGVSKFPYSDEVTVARLDDDLWLEGFNGHVDGYVKGRMQEDGSIFIPSGQYIGQSGSYASYVFTANVYANGSLEPLEGLTLVPDGDGWKSEQYAQLRFGFNEDQIEFSHKNFTLKPSTNGIAEVGTSAEAVLTEIYDLSGRRVGTPAAGLYMRITTYADGTRRAEKITF